MTLRTPIGTIVLGALAAVVLASAPCEALAQAASAPTAPRTGVPTPAPRPSVVPSPKQDGSDMNPKRRTQSVDRLNAAFRLQERMKANEAAGLGKAKPAAPAKAG